MIDRYVNFDCNETYRLMKKFREFNACEVRILDYLMTHDVYEGSYQDLTEIIGMKAGNVTNVCKAINHLEKAGIVGVMRRESAHDGAITSHVDGFYLIDEWMYALLMGC